MNGQIQHDQLHGPHFPPTSILQLQLKMKRYFTNAFCDACKTIRNRPGTFDRAPQSTIRRVQACTDEDGGHFEHQL